MKVSVAVGWWPTNRPLEWGTRPSLRRTSSGKNCVAGTRLRTAQVSSPILSFTGFPGLPAGSPPAKYPKCHRLPLADLPLALAERGWPGSLHGSSETGRGGSDSTSPCLGAWGRAGVTVRAGWGVDGHRPPPEQVFSSGHPSFLPSIRPSVHLCSPRLPSPLFQRPPAAAAPETEEKTGGVWLGGQAEGANEQVPE